MNVDFYKNSRASRERLLKQKTTYHNANFSCIEPTEELFFLSVNQNVFGSFELPCVEILYMRVPRS